VGQFVLEHWIGRNTSRKFSPDEERKIIMDDMNRYFQNLSNEEKETSIKIQREWNMKLLHSATKEKGILAVASACCGIEAVRPVEKYVHRYYGWRRSQCMSLLAVLAWIDDYSATGFLIKTAERFRTPTIRKEAEKLMKELAARKGWTLNELSDRILPTGGFDVDGKQMIEIGDRKIMVSVDDAMKIHLYNEDGEEIQYLPTSQAEVEDESEKEGNRLLSFSKKAVKAVKKREPERLYEAMCTQRTWRFDEWDRYLNRHPIMTHFCQRVVWSVFQEETVTHGEKKGNTFEGKQLGRGEDADDGKTLNSIESFRPLPDHSLIDHQGNEVELPDNIKIRVAHTITLTPDEKAKWIHHMKDQKIKPLLKQFPPHSYVLPDMMKNETIITDFKGHVITGYTVERVTKKLGYVPGPKEGTFYNNYVKKLSGAGLEIHLIFSGLEVDLLDENTAIIGLSFARTSTEWESEENFERRFLPLGSINPILIAEGYEHLKTIAKKGDGFDADWKLKYNPLSLD